MHRDILITLYFNIKPGDGPLDRNMQHIYTRHFFTIMTFVSGGVIITQLSPTENNGISLIRIYFLRVDWIQLAEGWVHVYIYIYIYIYIYMLF